MSILLLKLGVYQSLLPPTIRFPILLKSLVGQNDSDSRFCEESASTGDFLHNRSGQSIEQVTWS